MIGKGSPGQEWENTHVGKKSSGIPNLSLVEGLHTRYLCTCYFRSVSGVVLKYLFIIFISISFFRILFSLSVTEL